MKSLLRNRKWLWLPLALLLFVPLRLRWYSSSGVILVGPGARQLLSQCSRATPRNVSAYSTASWSAVNALEKTLPTYLSRQKTALPGSIDARDYCFQYAGFSRGGRDFVYINAFPAGENLGPWRFSPIIVCDGGSSFFGLEYDVAAKQFSHLEFNGAA